MKLPIIVQSDQGAWWEVEDNKDPKNYRITKEQMDKVNAALKLVGDLIDAMGPFRSSIPYDEIRQIIKESIK